MVFDNEINEIKGNVDENIIEIYNHNDGNSDSNSKRLKLISFFINNRLDHFKQLLKIVIMIPSIFDNAEIGNVLSLLMETYNYNDSNSGSNFKCAKLISFFINNRLDHFE